MQQRLDKPWILIITLLLLILLYNVTFSTQEEFLFYLFTKINQLFKMYVLNIDMINKNIKKYQMNTDE